jgi:CubicO group peptidase (beta-lactamase class C family)
MTTLKAAYEALDAYIDQNLKTMNVPGMAIGLTDHEKLLCVSTYGFSNLAAGSPVRPETLFEIGSISKSFACTVILQLQEEGRLNVHQPVITYLPWFQVQSRFEPITLHHIMTHTAGLIGGGDAMVGSQSEVWALREIETSVPPGSFFHYSNVGYKVLGLILERLLNQSIAEIFCERLFEPLGMTQSQPVLTHNTRRTLAVGYEPFYDDRPLPPGGLLAPATWLEGDSPDGAISSSVVDMAAYMRMLLNRGRGPNGFLLPKQNFDLLTQCAVQPDDGYHGEFYGYGLNVGVKDGSFCIWHGGGMVGYRSTMKLDMENGLGVIVLTNGPSCHGDASIDALGWYGLRRFAFFCG